MIFPKKMSEAIVPNWHWTFDIKNPKILVNLPQLYEAHLDVDISRMFARYKLGTMKNYVERGYYPNTLISEITQAEDDYRVLKEMFKLP
jgi:hypothetical protein